MITMNLARIMYEGRRWSWRQRQHTYYEPNMSLKHFHFAQFYGFKKWKNKTMLHVHKIWCVVLLNITCHSGYTLLIAHVHVYTTFISSFIYLALISDVFVRRTLINKIIKMKTVWILFKDQFSILLPSYFVTSILKCIYLYAYIFSCGMFGSLYGKQIYKVFLRLGITYNLKVSHFLSKPREWF